MENKSSIPPDTKRQGRLIVGIIGLVLAAAYVSMAFQLPMGTPDQPGPGVFPLVVGALVAGASLVLIEEQLARGGRANDGPLGLPRGASMRRVVGFAIFMGVYVLVANFFGNLVASFTMCLGLVRLTDPRSWRRTLATAAAVALCAHAVFVIIFGVPLPEGSLLR